MSTFRPDVALSRVQTVYAVIQDNAGELAFPGPEHLILPTGDAVANQSTPLTDSREKADTLDVRNVFQGVASPANLELSMYLRTAGFAADPQGHALLQALQGRGVAAATGTLLGDVDTSASSLKVTGLSGTLPERGVLRVGPNNACEDIHYRAAIPAKDATSTVELTDLTRGYRGTTPTAFSSGAEIRLVSRWYGQSTYRPELTVWVQTDSTLQCVEGCRVTEASVAIATSDAVEFRFTMTGRRMWNAGESSLAVAATTGETVLHVADARAFFVGQQVRNTALDDAHHRITAIDEVAKTLTLDGPLVTDWNKDAVLTWWMPGGDPIGREVENRDTTMRVAGERGTMLPGSIKLGTPVKFTEEVGDRFPGQGIDDTRSCSIDYNVLMRKDAAQRLREGFEGREVRYDAEFGAEEGYRMAVVAPRMKLTTANVGFQAPTVVLSTSGRLLGTGKGENSVQIILE